MKLSTSARLAGCGPNSLSVTAILGMQLKDPVYKKVQLTYSSFPVFIANCATSVIPLAVEVEVY